MGKKETIKSEMVQFFGLTFSDTEGVRNHIVKMLDRVYDAGCQSVVNKKKKGK